MDLQDNLIESKKGREKSVWRTAPASLAIHGLVLAFVVFMSAHAVHKVNAEDKAIHAFVVAGAAPPPPPPPPPPAGSSAPKSTPVKPVEVTHQTFVQPREIPKEVPKADPTPSQSNSDSSQTNDSPGVPGGVEGGVVGGVVGGQLGGVLGGQLGGVPGGQLGGTPGGTGDAKPPEPPADAGPLRVGGDVKAPVVVHRVDPQYPDIARKSRLAGVVIVEAIIDKNGNVDQVKVLKGLPMGLTENAEADVKQWKFKPGTLNGEPVDVIFNLTVNFTLSGQ